MPLFFVVSFLKKNYKGMEIVYGFSKTKAW